MVSTSKTTIIQKFQYSIIALGPTGSGKSTVLNSLALGTHKESEKIFQEGDLYTSQTQDCIIKYGKFKRRASTPIFQFVDTPGFMDSSLEDIEIIQKICEVLQELKLGINIILYCFPASRNRLSQDIQSTLRWLGQLFGNGVYKHVKICITQIDKISQQERESTL